MVYQRIRDLREDSDMNQTKVAEYLGMSQTGYSKYETGENDIPTQILIKLAELYDTSIDYLLGETNERKRYPKKQKERYLPFLNFLKLRFVTLLEILINCTADNHILNCKFGAVG